MENVEAYYAEHYNILINSEEEDDLYKIVDGRKVFRIDHQVETLLQKVFLPGGACVLDYGSGKGAVLKKLSTLRPDLVPHLFDVSDVYVPYWSKFAQPENWATHTPPKGWHGYFDIVTSFFSLEHVRDPNVMLKTIAGMLKPGGVFYGVVPNVYTNAADFVVVDHINHFSESSLRYLFMRTGFDLVCIDAMAHDSAFVIVGKKKRFVRKNLHADSESPSLKDRVEKIGEYWETIAAKVRTFERQYSHVGKVAIYGSGFYGTFLATCLRDRSKVECFLDQNPYKRGKTLFGRPIIAPEDLPNDIGVLYVGLNPQIAMSNIQMIADWKGRNHTYFFL